MTYAQQNPRWRSTWFAGRFTKSLRLFGTGVTANAMAPGLIAGTGLYRHTPRLIRGLLRLRVGGRIPVDGADTAVWLASDGALAGTTGKLFENRKEIPCQFRGVEDEKKLWSICERLGA